MPGSHGGGNGDMQRIEELAMNEVHSRLMDKFLRNPQGFSAESVTQLFLQEGKKPGT